jgi:hypothetical protein
MMVRMLRRAAVLLTLLALPPAGWAEAPGPSAGQLARSVEAALAAAAEAAKAPKGGLDNKNPKQASFLLALHDFRTRVGQIEAALAPSKPELYLLIDQGSSDLGELRVAWARTGAKNERIAAAVRTASASYRRLRADYGREGLRRRQGGELSTPERQQLQRLQGAEQRFAASLQPLRDRARAKGDATTAAELERFRAEAESLAVAAADLSTYLNALIATSELRGEWHADVPYIRKSAPPVELAAADDTVQDLYVDSDFGQVFTADLGATPADGAGAAGSAATPEAGGTVEVYQASSEGPTEVVVAEPVADAGDTADATDAADGGAVVAEPVVETEPAGTAGTADKVTTPAEAQKPAAKDPRPGAPAAAPSPAPPPIG